MIWHISRLGNLEHVVGDAYQVSHLKELLIKYAEYAHLYKNARN